MSWFSGSGQLVVTVNNFRFNKPYRKLAVNLFAAWASPNFTTDYDNMLQEDGSLTGSYESDLSGYSSNWRRPRLPRQSEIQHRPRVHGYLRVRRRRRPARRQQQLRPRCDDVPRLPALPAPHPELQPGWHGQKTGAKKSEPLYWANPMSRSATPSPHSKPVRCTIRPIPTATASST
jgi:hypothetical protein